MRFFTDHETLKHVDELDLWFCLVPVSQTYAATDAIVHRGLCHYTSDD